jgi:hypothetical protein
MDDQIEPADAARALSEIGRRREQVIRRAATPRWFWWASAVLVIASAAAADSGSGALSWAGIALWAAGTLAVNALVLFRRVRAPLRDDLVAPGSDARMLPAALVALVAAPAGVALATLLSLEAARVPYPATIACAAGMAVFVAGGQALTRYNTAFLVRRSGGRG